MTAALQDSTVQKAEVAGPAAEDVLRANTYALLATLLRKEPDQNTLRSLAELPSDESELGQALAALGESARSRDAESVADEFYALFIGIGESELKPYGSYYLTGFMYEKPLAKLRAALADFGIASADGTVEPEDHIAALCEVMCALIMGEFGTPVALDAQRAFFDTYVGSWAPLFFADLEAAESASFYGCVGTIGRLFMRIEAQAFAMGA